MSLNLCSVMAKPLATKGPAVLHSVKTNGSVGPPQQSFRQSCCWFNPGRPDWPDGPPAVVLMLRTEEEEEAIGQKRSPLEPNRKQTDMKSNGSERMKRVLVHPEEEEE